MGKFALALSGLALICLTAPSNTDACEVYTTPKFENSPSVTIIEPCLGTLYPAPVNADVKPSLSQRVTGTWQAEATYHPGNRWVDELGREHIRTATIFHKPKTDFLQLNPNGRFTERCNGKDNSGFYGLDYNPKQNSQGRIGFYDKRLELIKTGKIEVSNTHLRITDKNNWSYVFKKPEPTPAPEQIPTPAPELAPIPQIR